MGPIGAAFFAEFFRAVIDELRLALKRRRQKRARDKQRKEVLRKQLEQYERDLTKLRKGSKIPENPYGE